MAEIVHNYVYEPLDGPNAIRALRLGSYNEETMIFQCSLESINLNDSGHPPYYALSYTWQLPKYEGEETPLRPSPIHVCCDNKILEIGENLFDCLYQLEHLPKEDEDQSDDGLIWIDAICINQADLDERSSQVALMQKIYSQAAGTLIWLGKEDRISSHAIPLIQKLSEAADSHLTSDDDIGYDTLLLPGQLRDEEFFSFAGIPPLTLADWNTISAFFARSWFHRVWTVQELVMGNWDDKIMLCGDKTFSLEDVGGFIHLAMAKGWINTLRTLEFTRNSNAATSLGIEISLAMGAIYKALQDGPMSKMLQHAFQFSDEEAFLVAKFAWMMNMCRQKKATDQRDRVFASSGMISQYRKPEWWHLLGPDYSIPTEAVFTNASKFIIKSLGNLSWLSLVEDKSLRLHRNLPSWVPDLAVVSRPMSLVFAGSYNVFRNYEGFDTCHPWCFILIRFAIGPADWTLPFDPRTPLHNTSLSAKGCKIDSLAYTVQDLNETFTKHSISNILLAAARFETYDHGDTWLVALMKTLAVGNSVALDLDTNAPAAAPTECFDDIWPPFLHHIKVEIAQEIWRWNSSIRSQGVNWWDAHEEFARLCDSNGLLPSREEFEDFFSVLTALYPRQDEKTNPIIEDADYLEIVHNPQLPFVKRASLNATFRVFVQTRKARMGLAPFSAKLEDEVWILHGAKVPFILRPRSDGTYEFIGEAYIHGIMQGELFESGDQPNFRYLLLE